MQQDQAQRLFEAGGFFILPLDKQGTEFGIDGSLWAVKQDKFAGIKFLPAGFHLFVYSAPPSHAALEAEGLPASASATPFGEGITIRHGLFRFSKPKEIIVRRYDNSDEIVYDGRDDFDDVGGAETLEDDEDEMGDSAITKRLKSSSGTVIRASSSSAVSQSVSETIISPEYLKTLDPKLAPYPFDKQAEWKRLTSLITSHTLHQVLGYDDNGDSRCDSLMSSLADEKEAAPGASGSGRPRSQWGKERRVNEIDEMDRTAKGGKGEAEGDWQEDVIKGKEKCMRFATFDLKRSWKEGAVGEEITRDSRDKSWLLGHIIETQVGDSAEEELLAQTQLAFVIFTQLQNFSALDTYKTFLSLFCRCISTFVPSSAGLPPIRSIPLYTKLLDEVVTPHIEYLRTEFFSQDLPGLDGFIQEELANLRMSLRAAYRHYFPTSVQPIHLPGQSASIIPIDEDGNLSIPFKDLCQAWERLRKATETKFGWLLGRLEPDDVTLLRQQLKGRIEYNLLAEADEEDEYREEGEDAPVVVEL